MDVAAAPTNVGTRVDAREGIALIVSELWAHQEHAAGEIGTTLTNVVAQYFNTLITTNVFWCPMATKHQNFQYVKDVGGDGTSVGARVDIEEATALNVRETKAHKVHVAGEIGTTLLNVQELPSDTLVIMNVFW